MSPQHVLPADLESVFELGLVLGLTLDHRVPHQGHGPAALSVLVPQHRREAAVVVFAVNPDLLHTFFHNQRRWLLNGDTVRTSC